MPEQATAAEIRRLLAERRVRELARACFEASTRQAAWKLARTRPTTFTALGGVVNLPDLITPLTTGPVVWILSKGKMYEGRSIVGVYLDRDLARGALTTRAQQLQDRFGIDDVRQDADGSIHVEGERDWISLEPHPVATAPAPSPNGCQHCGIDGPHGWQYTSDVGLHRWVQPTQVQILARMRARRAARQNAEPTRYHAATKWFADESGESADPCCADCAAVCHQYARIQDRLDQHRWSIRSRTKHPLPAPYEDLPW